MRRTTDIAARHARDRRRFLAEAGSAILCGLAGFDAIGAPAAGTTRGADVKTEPRKAAAGTVRLFLGGDVMTGRGIDQIMAQPGDPRLQERVAKSALDYVALAEKKHGPIPRNVAPNYIWGDALAELERLQPDARIVNLETAVTTAGTPWAGKPIHYRMHPANVACLTAANIDCCTLANNHVLDWGYLGLQQTLETLQAAGVLTTGAGARLADASAPAVISLPSGARVLVFAYGSPTSGIPRAWAAAPRLAGMNVIDERDPSSIGRIASAVRESRREGDRVIVSVHWGPNWGYAVPGEQRRLARALIDEAGVDVVCGHSSHHPRPIEVYGGKLILYGCGDLLNDYEGVGGHDSYRPELGLMYVPELDESTGRLGRLTLVPTRVQKFRILRATADDAEWLRQMLEREGRAFGTQLDRDRSGALELRIG